MDCCCKWTFPLTWMFLLAFIIPIIIGLFPNTQKTNTFTSTKSGDFTQEPTFFVHLSDIHINAYKPDNSINFEKALNISLGMRAQTVFVTGDIMDGEGSNSIMVRGHQSEEDWAEYRRIIDQYFQKYAFYHDQPGNHDAFGVPSFEYDGYLFMKHSISYNRTIFSNFTAYQASLEHAPNSDFIFTNGMDFPFPNGKIEMWIDETPQYIEAVRAKINEANSPYFIASHFPVLDHQKKAFHELVRDSGAIAFLAGHVHRSVPRTYHHGDTLECIGPDNGYHKGISVGTLDNGNFVFHSFYVDSPPSFLILNPVPRDQLTSKTFFNTPTKIRVLSFKEQDFIVTGDTTCKLEFKQVLSDGNYLYEAEVELGEGDHTIKVNDQQVEFHVGSTMEPFTEYKYDYSNFMDIGFEVLIISIILFGIVAFPFVPIPSKHEEYESGKLSIWVFLNGPLIMHHYLMELPLWGRFLVFLFAVSPLLLPIGVLQVEDAFGVIYLFGYFANGRTNRDPICICLSAVYEVVFVFGGLIFVVLETSIERRKVKEEWVGLDWLIIGVLASLFMALYFIREATGWLWGCLSPLLVLLPIGCLIGASVRVAKRRKNPKILDLMLEANLTD